VELLCTPVILNRVQHDSGGGVGTVVWCGGGCTLARSLVPSQFWWEDGGRDPENEFRMIVSPAATPLRRSLHVGREEVGGGVTCGGGLISCFTRC
jgi:hypothetical protein